VWIWSSHDNTARHLTVPAGAGDSELKSKVTSSDEAMTPQQAADTALKAITPTTRVSTDATAVVAGRPAYQLVLEPRDPATLIGTVTIAIDGDTHVPIRVQVFARGATSPAFETGFTSFNPSTPPSSVFDFNPPPGATVTDGIGGSGTDRAGGGTFESSTKNSKPEIVGKGWTSIIKADLPTTSDTSSNASSEPGSSNPLGSLEAVMKSLPTVSGTWGSGHLLRGTLFTVLVTDNGQVVAGAVAPERLYAALSAQ
jgi:hypothetical protein